MAVDPVTMALILNTVLSGTKGEEEEKRGKGGTIASILAGVFKGASGALGGGGRGGASRRQIDEGATLQRQRQNNQALQQLQALLLRSSGRGGF